MSDRFVEVSQFRNEFKVMKSTTGNARMMMSENRPRMATKSSWIFTKGCMLISVFGYFTFSHSLRLLEVEQSAELTLHLKPNILTNEQQTIRFGCATAFNLKNLQTELRLRLAEHPRIAYLIEVVSKHSPNIYFYVYSPRGASGKECKLPQFVGMFQRVQVASWRCRSSMNPL